jgi:hypothetical protein
MKKFFFTASVLVFSSAGAWAQYTTQCTQDIFGTTCTTNPSRQNGLDLFAYERGARQAIEDNRQQQLMQQQIEMQQRILEQQHQIRIQQERLNLISSERSTSEWQRGELFSRDEGKGAGGSLRCGYRPRQGFVFVKGKQYPHFYSDVPSTQNCPAFLHVSKITGLSK